MNTEKKWYAVYTKPRWEKKVAELLTKRRIDNYCPLNKVVRQWSDRRKTVMEPLFTSYVFVSATEMEHLAIKQTEGIINLVYWLGTPAIIRDAEIDSIKEFLSEHTDVTLERVPLNIADRVRITSGALAHCEGNVLEVQNKTVKLFLPSLGYKMVADVSRVEVLDRPQRTYSSTAQYRSRALQPHSFKQTTNGKPALGLH